jgi:hypothetical protein
LEAGTRTFSNTTSACPPRLKSSSRINLHRKKRLDIFQSPAGMSLTKLSLAGKNFIIPGQGEFGK